jgi:hypothetical protein
MSADMLREAAALMRQRAEAAKPSPWGSGLMGVWSEETGYIASSVHEHNPCKEAIIDGADRVHIASWHPAVARAVADWLEATAAENDAPEGSALAFANFCTADALAAVEVARAYLGRTHE